MKNFYRLTSCQPQTGVRTDYYESEVDAKTCALSVAEDAEKRASRWTLDGVEGTEIKLVYIREWINSALDGTFNVEFGERTWSARIDTLSMCQESNVERADESG